MATVKINVIFITVILYMALSYCTAAHQFYYGMKEYTFVLDRTANQETANTICKRSYGSSLAVIIDTATLQQLSEWLFSLRGKFKSNSAIHELWTGGRSDAASHSHLDLQQSQPIEDGDRCLVLSNYTDQNLKGYNLYSKDCHLGKHFVCEKDQELVESSVTFGSFPSFDSKVRKFNDHDQTNMLSAVTVYEYKDDNYQYISCIAFTYGDKELPCRGDHVVSEKAHILQLQPTEYITEVSGEQSWAIRQITFKTNLKRTLTAGVASGFGQFHVSNDGAPLIYVSGAEGMWLYQLQFHFFYARVDKLQEISYVVASKVYNALKTAELESLLQINKRYQHMLPDVAIRGCNIFMSHSNGNDPYEAACELKFLLEQLNIYTTSTNAIKKHLPRNLMKIANFNSQILLQIVTEAKKFHSLLTQITFTIKEVGSEIQDTVVSVNQDLADNLNNYFSKVAEFDKQIARADREYVTEKIGTLTEESANLMDELNTRIYVMLAIAVTLTAADVVETGINLAIAVGKVCNPLGWLFGSHDPNEVADRVSKLTTAIRHATHAAKLLSTLHVFSDYIKDLSKKFAANERQITVMRAIVQEFPDANDIRKQQLAEDFIEKYTEYTPKVSSHHIVYAAELLSAVIGEGCSLIAGTTGTIANVLDSVRHIVEIPVTLARKEPSTICTELQPLLSKLRAMYESVFNFQFDLIDAFTRMVRANVAQNMAGQISNIKEVKRIEVQTAAVGSLMVEIRCQAVTHARCQEIEYMNGGNRPDICKHIHFTDSIMNEIIAYEGTVHSSMTQKFAFIPMTQSSTDMSAPYLDVADLIANGVTYFQLPLSNKEWMVKYKWLPGSYFHPSHDKQTSYLVSRLEMFVPGLKCQGLSDYALQIDITSGNDVKLYSEEAPSSYVIPEALYRFIYKKAQTCPGSGMVSFEVRYDDADLSQGNQESVCVLSNGETDNPLKPSLYSTWIIKLLSPQGCEPVIDFVPADITPLITVKFKGTEVVAGDMNECWPPLSRCDRDQRCVDGILSYTCQSNG